MDLSGLPAVLTDEPPYRLRQLKKAVYQELPDDWAEVTTLPLSLREELSRRCPLEINAQSFISKRKDSSKALILLNDGLKIEAVLMRHRGGRNTVCVSSQVGCPMGCAFCATGKIGFKRNLNKFEIVEQVIFFARSLKEKKLRVTNVVFMGMGEPFLNYDNVLSAIRILNDKDGFGLGARRFSISTYGMVEGIRRLTEEALEINLAISLHAPNDKLRLKLMPAGTKCSIKKILDAVDGYIKNTKRRVMFEYLMIKDFNDTEIHAHELAALMKKRLYFVNLISYNPTGSFVPSPPQRAKCFKEILEKAGVVVTQRYRFGEDIDAACGQLAANGASKI